MQEEGKGKEEAIAEVSEVLDRSYSATQNRYYRRVKEMEEEDSGSIEEKSEEESYPEVEEPQVEEPPKKDKLFKRTKFREPEFKEEKFKEPVFKEEEFKITNKDDCLNRIKTLKGCVDAILEYVSGLEAELAKQKEKNKKMRKEKAMFLRNVEDYFKGSEPPMEYETNKWGNVVDVKVDEDIEELGEED